VGVNLLNFNDLICAQETKAVYSVRGLPLNSLAACRRYPHAEYGSGCNCGIRVT
jgi:hypothetical protein